MRTPVPYRAPVVDPVTGGTTDEYGQTNLAEAVTIKARVEPKLRMVQSGGQQVQSEIRLFTTHPVALGGVCTVMGRDWAVLSAAPQYDFDGITIRYWDVAL